MTETTTVFPAASSVAEVTPHEEAAGKLPVGLWVTNLIAVTLPFLGLGAAPIFLWGWGFHWIDLGLLLGMYVLTGLGITVGYHRLFTHRAFETYPAVQLILGVFGSMAVQGPLLHWVAMHRRHHQHSDRLGDPHSPHLNGGGILDLLAGLWHSHWGWLFQPDPPGLTAYVKDLRQSRIPRLVHALFPVWIAAGLVIPSVLGGVISHSWMGVCTGLVWGGLVRILLVHHVTFSVNSVCHFWGFRPYRSEDHSRNNFLFGVLALGEGWHNTHHAFPTSARHGLRWWQPDTSYWVIRALAWTRLAWNVKLPSKEAQIQEQRT